MFTFRIFVCFSIRSLCKVLVFHFNEFIGKNFKSQHSLSAYTGWNGDSDFIIYVFFGHCEMNWQGDSTSSSTNFNICCSNSSIAIDMKRASKRMNEINSMQLCNSKRNFTFGMNEFMNCIYYRFLVENVYKFNMFLKADNAFLSNIALFFWKSIQRHSSCQHKHIYDESRIFHARQM